MWSGLGYPGVLAAVGGTSYPKICGALLPLDLIVVVYADEETQLERIMARDQLSREDALSRVRAQLSIEKKRGLADVVIDNSGDWETAAKQVRECYAEWISDEAPNVAPR